MSKSLLQYIPSVDTVLQGIDAVEKMLPGQYIVRVVREVIGDIRNRALNDSLPQHLKSDPEDIERFVIEQTENILFKRSAGSIKSVINATGIVLHTGLGRAPLSELARDALQHISAGYSNLEFDLISGKRGQRNDHIEDLLCALTGSEAGLMVNNNAAAVTLALNTLAEGGEAIISRGQLVEIGGSFRIPEVMAKSGAEMVEIGTTNRTHLWDYENAITDNTRLVLVVHTSNYRVEGFTTIPALKSIVQIAHARDLPVLYDLGSGAMVALENYALPYEPVVRKVLQSDVDVVTFSGDKLIGGPQAGLIAGKKRYLDVMKKNPLNRVLRCDKLIHAAMEATLRSYVSEEKLPETNLTYNLLTRSLESMRVTGKGILDELNPKEKEVLGIYLTEADVEAGSGSLPTESIPGLAFVIPAVNWSANKIMWWMRTRAIPVIGYIQEDQCYFNIRTILENQESDIARAFKELANVMEKK